MASNAECEKIVVSLTTIPSRVVFLRKTIESLLSQTHKPCSIELNIPEVYRKRDLGSVNLSSLPDGISVFRCEDSGPATKLLPTLSRYSGQNVCIIYCDDDRIYEKNMIARLLDRHRINPKSAVAEEVVQIKSRFYSRRYKKDLGYRLRRLLSGGYWKPSRNDPTRGQIVQGFGGVLVRPDFFPVETFEIDDEFFMVDDIWLSAMLAMNDVKVTFSGRTTAEKSSPVVVDGRALGRSSDSLVTLTHEGLNRNDLDWRAIRLASERYGVWVDEVHELLHESASFGSNNNN
jgi:hypothetical protein